MFVCKMNLCTQRAHIDWLFFGIGYKAQSQAAFLHKHGVADQLKCAALSNCRAHIH
jgi:hypothetical protein